MKNSVNLTVSIVNYNAGDHLLDCLASLEKVSDEVSMEVVVVDNASVDDSIEKAKKKFPNVSFVLNKENYGFGKAHNQVLRVLTTEYVLILNPDIVMEKGILKKLFEYMDAHEEVGAITPKVVFENGKIDLTAHRGFPTPWASMLYFLGDDSKYHLSKENLDEIHEVDAITGAFLLTRKSVLEKSGYFDEDYFMYAEDIDLCYRIKQAGFKIIYFPEVKVLHYKGISSGLKKQTQQKTSATLETRQRSLNWFYKTMIIFYDKHYKNHYPFFVNWIVYAGIYGRWWMAKRKLTV